MTTLRTFVKNSLRRWAGMPPPRVASTPELQAIVNGLRAGDLAIDCGANVGSVTEVLAWHGARVHAFEPNPHAFRVLQRRFFLRRNVVCHRAAVGLSDGVANLFPHINTADDPVYWSTGSSLLAEKGNVDPKLPIAVDTIDLTRFLIALDCDIAVLKIDIEGAEVELLERLIDTPLVSRIRHILVETHDSRMPHLAKRMNEIRQRIEANGLRNIRLDWH